MNDFIAALNTADRVVSLWPLRAPAIVIRDALHARGFRNIRFEGGRVTARFGGKQWEFGS